MHYKDLKEVSKKTRAQIVPFYVSILKDDKCSEDEIKRVNDLILTKFKPSGLNWIKEQAWKEVTV